MSIWSEDSVNVQYAGRSVFNTISPCPSSSAIKSIGCCVNSIKAPAFSKKMQTVGKGSDSVLLDVSPGKT
jgi:hypothetical protein